MTSRYDLARDKGAGRRLPRHAPERIPEAPKWKGIQEIELGVPLALTFRGRLLHCMVASIDEAIGAGTFDIHLRAVAVGHERTA